LSDRFFSIMSLLLENFYLSIFDTNGLKELVEVDVAHELHLLSDVFQLGEPFNFGLLEFLQFVFLQLFKLYFILKPF